MDLDIFGINHTMLMNYRFLVLVDNFPVSFSKITGLNLSVETELLTEGGRSQAAYILETPSKSPKTLRMESGVYNIKNLILNGLRPGMYLKYGIVIMVLGSSGILQRTFIIDNAMVTKWEISDLDAANGQVLVNTFELAYTEVIG